MVAFAPFNDDSCLEKSDHKRWNVFPVPHKRIGFVVIFLFLLLFVLSYRFSHICGHVPFR